MTAQTPASGRQAPPSKDDDRAAAIRRTVIELVARHGYDSVTVDAVAQAAGASKATVYRRWATKPELVVDSIRGSISVQVEPADTGELRSDLLAILTSTADGLAQDADLLVALLDASRRHKDVWQIMSTQFREPGRDVDSLPLKRAIARREVTPECPSLFIDEVAMPMLIHRILWHESIDHAFLTHLVDDVLLQVLMPYRTNG